MNKNVLNSLFKPYQIIFDDINSLFDEKHSKELFMEILIDIECPKSKNETCANVECDYNIIHLHNNVLYSNLIGDGDAE